MMLLPTSVDTASTMTFNWSASSCASVCAVKVGRTVLPVVVKSSSALLFAALITDPAMIVLVDFTHVSMLLPLSRSFTMLLPGSLGLNWLTRTR